MKFAHPYQMGEKGMKDNSCRDVVRGLVALHLDRQPAARGFAVFGVHVFAGFIHGFDHLIQRDARFAGAAHGHA